jgi:hypothetical protein
MSDLELSMFEDLFAATKTLVSMCEGCPEEAFDRYEHQAIGVVNYLLDNHCKKVIQKLRDDKENERNQQIGEALSGLKSPFKQTI